MKSFFKKSVAILLFSTILCGFFGFGMVHAETVGANSAPDAKPTETSKTEVVNAGTNQTAGANLISSGTEPRDVGVWSLLTGGVAALLSFILSIFNVILAIIMKIFDTSLRFSTNGINTIFRGDTITSMWALVRDTLNVFFIFMLLYVAIQKIIGVWGVKEQTKIGSIIVSALFINFSMFIAKFLIDIGNVFAITLYNNIIINGSISDIFTNHSGLLGLAQQSLSDIGNPIISILLQIVMVAIAGWFFIWGSVMFIGRAVMFIYYVITSPIAFVGGVFPLLKKESDLWWGGFINQILVAPVFIFFMLIVTSFLLKYNSSILIAETTKNGVPGVPVYFFYVLVIMLMIEGLRRSKELSGKVATVSMGLAKGAAALGALAVTGGTGTISGAFGKEASDAAAKAKAEGKSGFRARLAFSAQNTTAYKLATGKYEKEPGILGNFGRKLRKGTFTGVKEGTGGFLDFKAIETANKENERMILEKAAGNIKKKQDALKLKSTEDIEAEAKAQANKELGTARDGAQAQYEKDRQALNTSRENLKLALASNNKEEINRTKDLNTVAQQDFAASQAKIAEFTEKIKTRQNELIDNMKTENNRLLVGVVNAEASKFEKAGIMRSLLGYGGPGLAQKVREGDKGSKKLIDQFRDELEKEKAKEATGAKPTATPPASNPPAGGTTT